MEDPEFKPKHPAPDPNLLTILVGLFANSLFSGSITLERMENTSLTIPIDVWLVVILIGWYL